MFKNPRGGRQARNFTKNVQKILDLKSCSEQIFSENSRWVPLSDAGLFMSQTKINAMMHNFSCMTEMHIFPLLNL